MRKRRNQDSKDVLKAGEMLANGATLYAIAKKIGVPYGTVFSWKSKGWLAMHVYDQGPAEFVPLDKIVKTDRRVTELETRCAALSKDLEKLRTQNQFLKEYFFENFFEEISLQKEEPSLISANN